VGCPSAPEVTREVDELVASSPAVAAAPLMANASVASDQGGFVLNLALTDGDGTHFRRIDAPTCDELAHATALVVALAIDPALLSTHADPGGAVARAPAQPENVPGPAAGTSQAPQAFALPAPAWNQPPSFSNEPPQLLWRLGLVESVAFGTLPGVNLGTGLFGALQTKSFRFELAASSLSGTATLSGLPRASADFRLYRAEPKVCWLIANASYAFGPCSGLELGWLSGNGHGVDAPQQKRPAWVGSNHGALAELRLTSSSVLGTTVEAEIPWVRDRFILAQRILFQPAVSLRIGVSLAAGWQ